MKTPTVTVTSIKQVYSSKYFTVNDVDLSFGAKTATHQVVEVSPAATIFPITPKNEIYLINQYRYMLGGYVLGAAAGHIEKGETPLIAAKRELLEETGIKALQWEELTKIELARSTTHVQQYLFLARDLEVTVARPEEDEEIELVKMPIEEAVQMVFQGKITHAASIIGILMIDRLKKEKRL